MKEKDIINRALAKCKSDLTPNFVKQTFMDESGNLTKSAESFILFFESLKEVFGQHFESTVSKYTPEETWDALNNPVSCVKYICQSFMEEYKTNILNKMSEIQRKNIYAIIPEPMLPLIHKQFVMTSMFSLPSSILKYSTKNQVAYYKKSSGDHVIDDNTAIQRLLDIMENFEKQMAQLNNSVQDEWQNLTLDAFNNKQLSKEMMEFIMDQANKRKKIIGRP